MSSQYRWLVVNEAFSVRGGIRLVVMVAILASSPDILAVDVEAWGDAKLAEEYNTNLFLTPLRHNAVWGQGVDGALNLSAADPRWNTTVNANFNNRFYLGENNINYFNQLFDWKTNYLTERSVFGLDAQYNLDSTLTSIIDQTAALGFVFSRIPRTTRVVSPSWSYHLTEKTELKLGYDYRDTVYDKQKNPNRIPDSVSHTGSLDLSQQLTERLKLTASGSYNDYALLFPEIINVPSVTSSIRSAMITGGFSYDVTETLSIALSPGAQYNETVSPAFTETTVAPIYFARASKRFENGNLGVDFSRTISPNIVGQLISYDRYSISGTHQFAPNLSASLNLSYSDRTFPASPQQSSLSSQLFNADSAVNWQWSENWMMSASYQYYFISFGSRNSTTADQHALFLNIRYIFDRQEL